MTIEGPLVGEGGVMLLATPLLLSPILEGKIPLCIPPQAGFALR